MPPQVAGSCRNGSNPPLAAPRLSGAAVPPRQPQCGTDGPSITWHAPLQPLQFSAASALVCPCCTHSAFGPAVVGGAANAPAFQQLAKHVEWHLTRVASPDTRVDDAHAPLARGAIGGFASSVPQMSIDAGLAPCPGCKQMLSTVQSAGGGCEWEQHYSRCGACAEIALRLPHNGATNFASGGEYAAWQRQRSTCGSQAALAAEASTKWAYSTFLEAVESNQVEKVSFAADGKQVLSIDRDGNRHETLVLPEQSADLVKKLVKKNVIFAVQAPEQPSSVGALAGVLANLAFPLLIIGGLIFLQRRSQGGGDGGGGGGGGVGGDGGGGGGERPMTFSAVSTAPLRSAWSRVASVKSMVEVP